MESKNLNAIGLANKSSIEEVHWGYIYLITIIELGKVYVGQHRWENAGLDPDYICSSYSKEFWEDYKNPNYHHRTDLIEYVSDKITADIEEKYWIEDYRNRLGRDKVYNISDGGDGGWSGLLNLEYSDPERYRRIRSEMSRKAIRTMIENGTGCYSKESRERIIAILKDPEERARRSQKDRDGHGGVLAFNTKKSIENSARSRELRYGDSAAHMRTEKSLRESNEIYVYLKNGIYYKMRKSRPLWRKAGFIRLCKLSDWQDYCSDNGLDPSIELESKAYIRVKVPRVGEPKIKETRIEVPRTADPSRDDLLNEAYKSMGGFHVTEIYSNNHYDSEWRKMMSDAKKGKTHRGFSYKSVTNGVTNRKIHPSQVEEFLKENPDYRLGQTNKARNP